MKIEVPRPRSTITETRNGLEIVIPAKRNNSLLAFMGFWLIGWAVGEVAALHTLILGGAKEELTLVTIFLLAWLGFWTVGGASAIGSWLWMLRGKERITLQATHLTIKKDLFGFGRLREYDLQHISKLRVAPATFNMSAPASAWESWGAGGGVVAFDYGPTTVRFGSSIDEAEGLQIVESFGSHHNFREN